MRLQDLQEARHIAMHPFFSKFFEHMYDPDFDTHHIPDEVSTETVIKVFTEQFGEPHIWRRSASGRLLQKTFIEWELDLPDYARAVWNKIWEDEGSPIMYFIDLRPSSRIIYTGADSRFYKR